MAVINPLVHVIIGFIVTAISYYSDQLRFFTYVGLALVSYGIIRWFIFPAEQKKEKKEVKTTKEEQTPKKELHYPSRLCHRCGARLRPFDRYCFYCGVKVK